MGPKGGERVDKKLVATLKAKAKDFKAKEEAKAKANEWLLPSTAGYLEAEDGGNTTRFKQHEIAANVDAQTRRKLFDLDLKDLGPYRMRFSRNGRHVVLAGHKGHLGVLEWKKMRKVTEVQVRETTRDVTFLHNETFFAAAQKRYVYIYDKRGLEVHCCTHHVAANRLDFLPYHFLLQSVGDLGVLTYQDTATGEVAAQHKTKQGRSDCLGHNPWNGVSVVGHGNGTVSMWTPNMSQSVVSMICHHGPVLATACSADGRYLASSGMDGQIKVWDIRAYRELHSYFSVTPAVSLDISQTGMLAVGGRSHCQIWKDALATKATSPYLADRIPGKQLSNLRFCPYEDSLMMGHSGGLRSIIVPGSGEPNFDTWTANPFETKKQRQEGEVKSLLDKIPASLITLDADYLAKIHVKQSKGVTKVHTDGANAGAGDGGGAGVRLGPKVGEVVTEETARGKIEFGLGKPHKRYRKRQQNVVDARNEQVRELKKERSKAQNEADRKRGRVHDPSRIGKSDPALSRFVK